MNNNAIQETDYYEQNNDNIKTIEKAVLAKDVSFSSIAPVEGNFFIPAIMPGMETDQIVEETNSNYTKTNYVPLVIPPQFLLLFMNLRLVPISSIEDSNDDSHSCSTGYFLGTNSRSFKIPKGTEFLIEFLGGNMELDKISIVGIYSLKTVSEGGFYYDESEDD